MAKNHFIECSCGQTNLGSAKICLRCKEPLIPDSQSETVGDVNKAPDRKSNSLSESQSLKKKIDNLGMGKHVFKKKASTFVPYEFSPKKI